jgi:hypothetical protein
MRRKKEFKAHSIFYGVVIIGLLLAVWPQAGMAITTFTLGGKEGTFMGYVNQGVSFGIAGDEYDTQQGFQSSIFQLLLETELTLNRDLKVFGSVKCNADWAYPILSDNNEWDDKNFDQSRDDLFIYSHRRDIIQEAHFTWTPQNWHFRFGKQIVVWGETDGFRIMDQINPLDQRRGMADVEFETTVLPIWLLCAEYFPRLESNWLQDLGFQFVFNFNPDFRANEEMMFGNEKSGIWAPNATFPLGGPYPFDYAHIGSFDTILHRPGSFDSDGFEYGFRIKSVIQDTIVTLNGFYGRDNTPVAIMRAPFAPRMTVSPDDGRMELHLPYIGHYPLLRFVGFTLSRDFENLYVSKLGGVAPVLRVEAFYAWENTFETALNTFEKNDEIRWAIGIDWKVWIRAINPRAAFMISPQFYHRKVLNYPGYLLSYDGGYAIRDDNYQASLMINTSYFHNKIQPMFFWLRDITERGNMFKIQCTYERSDVWNYTLGVLLLDGRSTGRSFQCLNNKDQIYGTVGYRF